MKAAMALLGACLLLLPAAFPGVAAADEAAEMLSRVEEHYRSLGSLRAAFKQTEKVATLGRSREDAGTVMFKRPAGMRWEYAPPREKLIVASGGVLWIVMPAEKRAYRYPLDRNQLSRSPLALLFDREQRLGDFFSPTKLTRAGAEARIELRPVGSQDTIVSVTLVVEAREARVTGTVIRDVFGNVTTVSMSDVVEGVALDPALFTYEPPPGFAVSAGQGGAPR